MPKLFPVGSSESEKRDPMRIKGEINASSVALLTPQVHVLSPSKIRLACPGMINPAPLRMRSH